MNKQLANKGSTLNKNLTNVESLTLTNLTCTKCTVTNSLKTESLSCVALDIPTNLPSTTYSGTMYNSGTDVASGIFGTALAIGAQSANNTAITDYNSSNSLSETNGILSGSGAYSYFNTSLDNASGSPRYTVFGTHRFNLNADASGASNVNNRYIKQFIHALK